MKARLIILIAVIALFASCKKNSGTDNTSTKELKISEAEKTKITNYISSKRSKTDKLGNSSIDTVLKNINWEKVKASDDNLGNSLTALELKIDSNIMLLLLYSKKDIDAFTDVNLAVIKEHSVLNTGLLDLVCRVFANEKTSFTGTLSYYKVTRQLLYEAGYEAGERVFIKKFDKGPKPSNVTNISARCTSYYLVTYWSDGSTDYEYLYSVCDGDGPGGGCEQTRSLSYSSATAFNASRCGGGGDGVSEDESIAQEFNNYIQMQIMPTRTFFGASTSASQTPISGILTWNVVEATLGFWKIVASTKYSYLHDVLYDTNLQPIHKYDMTMFTTTGSHFVGSNTFIESTWVQTNLIDEVLNNNTSNAYGRSVITGTIRHRLRQPLPISGGILDFTFPVQGNELRFYPR